MPKFDREVAAQWATIGSFVVVAVTAAVNIWKQISVGGRVTEVWPVAILASAIAFGAVMHWLAMRSQVRRRTEAPAASDSDRSRNVQGGEAPSIEVMSAYPMRVNVGASATLIEWRNRSVQGEGGRVELINGSVHLVLWNKHGTARTGKTRQVSFT
jgi:hypothetical protein